MRPLLLLLLPFLAIAASTWAWGSSPSLLSPPPSPSFPARAGAALLPIRMFSTTFLFRLCQPQSLLARASAACSRVPSESLRNACHHPASAPARSPLSTSAMTYSAVQRGALHSPDYRLFVRDEQGRIVSPFHDIPLFKDEGSKVFNMVVEVPRWTNAKMEINLKEKLNPIKQDVKKGKLRFVANCFPHHGYIWNYGAFPQTWEDPSHVDSATNCKGDGDPIDVCEIGHKIHERGAIVPVKVLGTLAMIDEGETDWKILAIDVNDPLAEKLNDVQDVEREMPGFLKATVEWFKIYKMPDGKPPNDFAFDGQAKDREFAHKTIAELHNQWKAMMAKSEAPEGLSRVCTVYDCSSRLPDPNAAEEIVNSAAECASDSSLDSVVDKWHYVKT